MCSHFEAMRQWEHYAKYFHVSPPDIPSKLDMLPASSAQARECAIGFLKRVARVNAQ
jgi:hypothetical protein